MDKDSRIKIYGKYRKSILKNVSLLANDESYSAKHLFIKIEEPKHVIVQPKSEVLTKQKQYDDSNNKENNRVLVIKIVVTFIILVGLAIFGYFAFK
jgi:hypothetical protein